MKRKELITIINTDTSLSIEMMLFIWSHTDITRVNRVIYYSIVLPEKKNRTRHENCTVIMHLLDSYIKLMISRIRICEKKGCTQTLYFI